VTAALLATYLTTKPSGAPLAFLIVALVLFAVAGVVAGFVRDLYRVAICAGLVALVLALLTH
jgi:hypothetical protein